MLQGKIDLLYACVQDLVFHYWADGDLRVAFSPPPPRHLLLPHPGGRQFAGLLGGQVLGHREQFYYCTPVSGKSLSVRKAVRACGGSPGLGAISPGMAL